MIDLEGLFAGPGRRALRFIHGGRDPDVGLDCWGVCHEAHRRGGRPIPPCADFTDYAITGTRDLFDAVAAGGPEAWEPVDVAPPYSTLDVLVVPSDVAGAIHIYTVIGARSFAAVSSSRERGVHVEDYRVLDVLAAWRLAL